MKTFFFSFLAFFFFLFQAKSQKIYRFKKVWFASDTNIYLIKDPSNKINGTVIRKEKDFKSSYEIKDGKLNGFVIHYYKNFKTVEAEYRNGQKKKYTCFYTLSNQVERELNYQSNLLLNYKFYYPDGKTKYVGQNDLNGKPTGFHVAYFKDGNKKITVNFWGNTNLQEKEFYESNKKGDCSLYTQIRENYMWDVKDMEWYYKSIFKKDTNVTNSNEKVQNVIGFAVNPARFDTIPSRKMANEHFENLTLTQNNIQQVEFFNTKGDLIYSEIWSTWSNGEFTKIYENKKAKGKIEKTWIDSYDLCEITIKITYLTCFDLTDKIIPCEN